MKQDKENLKRPETDEKNQASMKENKNKDNEKEINSAGEEVLPTGIKPDGTTIPRDFEGHIPTDVDKSNINEKNPNTEDKNISKEFNQSKDEKF